MGGSVWLIVGKEDRLELKNKLLKLFPINEVGFQPCPAPALPECAEPAGFFIEWSRNKLILDYSIFALNSEWAATFGKEIVKRYKIKKAGWDSVGYCKTLEEFTRNPPFDHFVRFAEMRNQPDEAQRWLQTREIYTKEAAKILTRKVSRHSREKS